MNLKAYVMICKDQCIALVMILRCSSYEAGSIGSSEASEAPGKPVRPQEANKP